LKEQDAAGGRATEPSAPPYEDKFSHKTKIQSKDDSDFDSVSDEEGHEDTLPHQVLGTMHLGLPPLAKRLPALAKSPLQAALQAAHSQGEGRAGFRFTLYLRDWTQTTLASNRGFIKMFHLKL
jgi:hypothetical protein